MPARTARRVKNFSNTDPTVQNIGGRVLDSTPLPAEMKFPKPSTLNSKPLNHDLNPQAFTHASATAPTARRVKNFRGKDQLRKTRGESFAQLVGTPPKPLKNAHEKVP